MKWKTNPLERKTREPLPLRQAPRCLARTRSETPCQKPAAKGKKRCRLHGGAEGSGAPCGERNGSYRHGLFTREAIAERRALLQAPHQDPDGAAFRRNRRHAVLGTARRGSDRNAQSRRVAEPKPETR